MRDEVLRRVRSALEGRDRVPHPGPLATTGIESTPAKKLFTERFQAAGGEVEVLADAATARAWLAAWAADFDSVSLGRHLPDELVLPVPEAPPEHAALGVSMARYAVAETGSLVLDSRGGRRTQLLPPTHLVWVAADNVVETLADALEACRSDLPSALALHSGPSKSADIGQILVTGVHGPGRVVALVVGGPP